MRKAAARLRTGSEATDHARTYALSSGYYDAYYSKAQKVRTLIKQDFDKAFEQVDIIATPTSPSPAFKMGEKVADPLQMYLSDIFTISCNLAGLPGLSLPCGLAKGNLPIGLQLLGKPFDESTLLRTAHQYEQATDWHKRLPPLTEPSAPERRSNVMPEKVRFEFSAGGVVREKNQLLMVKVKNLEGKITWTFPKGHLEKGETAKEAALREVEEETGYQCEILEPLDKVEYFFKRENQLIKKHVTWFLMKPLKKSGMHDPKEIIETRWVPWLRPETWRLQVG